MRRLIILVGGTLLSACSLSGLVFDIGGGAGGSAGSTSTGFGGASSSGVGGGVTSTSGSMLACMSTSTSGAGGGGVEVNCTNGLDDDNDGMADCDDPDCMTAGYSCKDVPAGWSGPVAFFEGTPADNPCCPSDYPTPGPKGGTGATAQAFTCSACSCSVSATCTASDLVAHTIAGCGDVGSSTPQQDGQCHLVSGGYVLAAAPTVTLGNCISAGGAPVTMPPSTWMAAKQLCLGEIKGQGCTGTQVCARPTTGVFGDRLCVYAAGAQATCPAGFPVKSNFFTKFADTRGCAGCSCGSAVPPACTVTSSVYSSANCSGGVNKLIVDALNNGTCIAAPGATSFKTNVAVGSATCAAMGGGATGMVTEDTTTETTVCCTQ